MDNTDQRLELIKMMRNENKENMYRIQRREQILYPNRRPSYYEMIENSTENKKNNRYMNVKDSTNADDQIGQYNHVGFYIRLSLSIALFLLFFYMDSNNISYYGISSNMVQNMISDTFDIKSFAFMK